MSAIFPAEAFSFRRVIRRSVAAFAALAIGVTGVLPAQAQSRGGGVPIVRDAEIEALVADYAGPILKAANLGGRGVRVILVNSQSFNAFVDGRRIFINTGAIMQSETPNEIIGVIAHEAGHIAGGHQDRLREQLSRARTMAVIGMLLGVGVGVAGAASGSSGAAGAGGGIAMGSNEMAMRSLLSYQRTEEITADRLAVNYLNATGQSTKECSTHSSALLLPFRFPARRSINIASAIRCRVSA